MSIVVLNGVGGIAILLIAYGVASELSPGWRSPALDHYAPIISVILTLLATAATAWSAWLPAHNRPADVHSKLVIAPIVSAAVLVAFLYMYLFRKMPPDYVVNGFALLGLIGAIFRSLPFSEEPGLRDMGDAALTERSTRTRRKRRAG